MEVFSATDKRPGPVAVLTGPGDAEERASGRSSPSFLFTEAVLVDDGRV
jgi:hypothetical protein